MSKILFSPVGGTDPVSLQNLQDGALIHCCRKYQPDTIFLYLSKEMIENEEKDHRYTGCLKRLYTDLGVKMKCHLIHRPKLVDVHDFDFFYHDFIAELDKLMMKMNSDDVLYLNVSSGTPAMKGALVGWATLTDANVILLQVDTPEKSMNSHTSMPISYDSLDELWKNNLDNGKDATRCHEIKCPSLMLLKYKEMIKEMIRVYDYQGALRIILMHKKLQNKKYVDLIWYAKYRLEMDKVNMDLIATSYDHDGCFPISLPCSDAESRDLFEYALNLKVKSIRQEYADFYRGLSPLFTRLLILILKKNSDIGKTIVNDYLVVDKKGQYLWKNGVDKLIWESFWGTDSSAIPTGRLVWSDQIYKLIMIHCDKTECKEIRKDCALLREVEKKVRNVAAHEVRGITKKYIEKQFGKDKSVNTEMIMKLVERLFSYTDIIIPSNAWRSYNLMNRTIIQYIK